MRLSHSGRIAASSTTVTPPPFPGVAVLPALGEQGTRCPYITIHLTSTCSGEMDHSPLRRLMPCYASFDSRLTRLLLLCLLQSAVQRRRKIPPCDVPSSRP